MIFKARMIAKWDEKKGNRIDYCLSEDCLEALSSDLGWRGDLVLLFFQEFNIPDLFSFPAD